MKLHSNMRLFAVMASPESCLFLYGSAGTGKTLMLVEALKIKVATSELLRPRRRIRILVTTYCNSPELRRMFENKYFVNMRDVEVMSFKELCDDLGIKYNESGPRDLVEQVTSSLSRNTNTTTFLLVDEVLPCYRGQTTPDWAGLEVREGVVRLLGLTSRAWNTTFTEIIPPRDTAVIKQHMVFKHRNCPQIRNTKTLITIKTS